MPIKAQADGDPHGPVRIREEIFDIILLYSIIIILSFITHECAELRKQMGILTDRCE